MQECAAIKLVVQVRFVLRASGRTDFTMATFNGPSRNHSDAVNEPSMGLHPLRHYCGFGCRVIGRIGRHFYRGVSISASGAHLHRAVPTTYASALGFTHARISGLYVGDCYAPQRADDHGRHTVFIGGFSSLRFASLGLAPRGRAHITPDKR
jgi:hypothetical protein